MGLSTKNLIKYLIFGVLIYFTLKSYSSQQISPRNTYLIIFLIILGKVIIDLFLNDKTEGFESITDVDTIFINPLESNNILSFSQIAIFNSSGANITLNQIFGTADTNYPPSSSLVDGILKYRNNNDSFRHILVKGPTIGFNFQRQSGPLTFKIYNTNPNIGLEKFQLVLLNKKNDEGVDLNIVGTINLTNDLIQIYNYSNGQITFDQDASNKAVADQIAADLVAAEQIAAEQVITNPTDTQLDEVVNYGDYKNSEDASKILNIYNNIKNNTSLDDDSKVQQFINNNEVINILKELSSLSLTLEGSSINRLTELYNNLYTNSYEISLIPEYYDIALKTIISAHMTENLLRSKKGQNISLPTYILQINDNNLSSLILRVQDKIFTAISAQYYYTN